MTTQEQLAALEAQLAKVASEHPAAVMLAALDVLITVAAGDNPALRDCKRLQLMRGIASKLERMGIR